MPRHLVSIYFKSTTFVIEMFVSMETPHPHVKDRVLIIAISKAISFMNNAFSLTN